MLTNYQMLFLKAVSDRAIMIEQAIKVPVAVDTM